MNRPVLFNPAAAGRDDAISLFAAGRHQWIGFRDIQDESVYPRDYAAGITLPLFNIQSGIGLQVHFGQIGFQSRTDIRFDYAYRIELQNENSLALGVSAQLSHFSLDVSQLSPADPLDPLLFEMGNQSDLIPEAGFGIFFNASNKGWAGISVMSLLSSDITLGNLEMNDQTTLVAQGQYRIPLIENRHRKLEIAPSLLIKSNFKKTQAEIDLLGYLKDKYWFGAGYRFQDGIVILAGLQIRNISAGVSYDLTTGQLREATGSGSLELHIGYNIPVFPKVECHSGFNVRHL
jgi:type IX secretion system PorP/SprF family membrane protein